MKYVSIQEAGQYLPSHLDRLLAHVPNGTPRILYGPRTARPNRRGLTVIIPMENLRSASLHYQAQDKPTKDDLEAVHRGLEILEALSRTVDQHYAALEAKQTMNYERARA